MNFTREPLVETVITPKDGYKLVVRSSKGGGQEEFFVDALEVISFGKTCFYRSLEKPKCFLVPVGDYEILEVRESRMVLKTTGTERGIKIGGGRETLLKVAKEEVPVQEIEAAGVVEQRTDKRREKRRSRKRRGGKLEQEDESIITEETPFPHAVQSERKVDKPSLIPPPSMLISESITRSKVQQLASEENVSELKEQRVLTPPPMLVERETNIFIEEEEEEIPF